MPAITWENIGSMNNVGLLQREKLRYRGKKRRLTFNTFLFNLEDTDCN